MKRKYKITGAIQGAVLLAGLTSVPASAHVVVRPGEALSGAYQTFTVSAPNEREVAYTSIKLDIPGNLESIMPTAKPGWSITSVKTGEGEAARTTSITWTGTVDAGLRDEFTFSAKLPDDETELTWKAYQTYADGMTVSWDQKAEGGHSDSKDETKGPASTTAVMAESAEEQAAAELTADVSSAKNTANMSLYLSIAALVLTLGVIGYTLRK